jgi:hypothetical protein
MSTERFLIFMSQYSAHLEPRTFKTFAEAWEYLDKLVEDMGDATCLMRMYKTPEACLAANPEGRQVGSLNQAWQYGCYINEPISSAKKGMAWIMRITID